MKQKKDKSYLIGKVFGRLTIISEYIYDGKVRKWVCICECGKQKITQEGALRSGKTKSCGCFKVDENRNRLTKIGRSINKKHTGEYNSYHAMIQRCTNINNDRYINYGGRGISVCNRWLESFENFLEDMGEKPSSKHSIDRFPNINGNYEPSNCRWGTLEQQYRGMTKNRWVSLNGEDMIISDFCKKINKPLSYVHYYLKRLKTIEEIYKQVNG